jgi:hypothetical protein
MDCLFNLQIPKSSSDRFVIAPLSKTFITGIAKEYGAHFDSENKVLAVLSEVEYKRIIE